MAGHSHSSNIARRKGNVDSVRARVFSRCAKGIGSAVRQGGPDPGANLKLRYAIEKARAVNMPKDNIERVIKRAAGEQGNEIQELTYEGYAPGGVALMVICLTDNRNRTAPDVKHILEKGGGNMGSPGSVAFLFDFRSILVVETGERSEDEVLEIALEIGAEDVEMDGDAATIFAAAKDFLEVKAALEKRGFAFLSAEMGYVPRSRVEVASKDDAARVLRLVSTLEENDDVQNVYANYEIQDAWLDELTQLA